MQELEKMLQQQDFRDEVFAKVFNTTEGKLVLAYLEQVYRIHTPDYNCPNLMYWALGRQSVVEHIENVLKYMEK